MRCWLASFFVVFLFSFSASAQMVVPGQDRFRSPSTGGGDNSIGVMAGFGALDEDYFLRLNARTDLNLGPVGLGLQLPLNLRVIDRSPKNTGDYFGALRREDWDESSEYLRILRYLRYGSKNDTVYLRVGELSTDIGHGTIMSRYVNNLDYNAYRVGLQLDVNTQYGGVETMIGDMGSLFTHTTQSKLVGGRAYVRPWAFIDTDSFLSKISVGTSVVADINAPLEIAMQNGQPQVTSKGQLAVAKDAAALVYGFDTDVQVVNTDYFELTPYTDFNVMKDAGWGVHTGIISKIKLPMLLSLDIPMRLEYRHFSNNYVPAYFSTFYELERYQYGPAGARPKNYVMRNTPADGGLDGVFGDVALDLLGLVQLGTVYENYRGGVPNVSLYANVPALKIIQFKAYYARMGVNGWNDLFVFDNKSIAMAELRHQIAPLIYMVGQFSRRWWMNPSSHAYESKDAWNLGVESSVTF